MLFQENTPNGLQEKVNEIKNQPPTAVSRNGEARDLSEIGKFFN